MITFVVRVVQSQEEICMADSVSHSKAQDAWNRMVALGGTGVWDGAMVVMSFSGTPITDDDLAVFDDFPSIQVLDLSNTAIGDNGLARLPALPSLEELIVINTKISNAAIKAFQAKHPAANVTTKPPPKDAINPFTGKPI